MSHHASKSPAMLMRVIEYVLVCYESDRGYHSMSHYANEDTTVHVCPGMLMRVIEDTIL